MLCVKRAMEYRRSKTEKTLRSAGARRTVPVEAWLWLRVIRAAVLVAR